jgi:hypothetical protein
MLVRSWRFVTIMLTALSMSAAVAHLLELPAKIHMSGEEWVTVLHTLYPPAFGTVGAFFEVGAVVTALVLVLLAWRRPGWGWTVAAAACLVVMHAIFWVLVAPVNATMGAATPATLPPDWPALRDQWEYSHAARALLQIAALGALVCSLLIETPESARMPRVPAH